MIPSWAKDPSIGYRTLYAGADSVADKPSFRSPFKSRRCLIVADGFYEWQKLNAKKQPYLIQRKDGQPFGFAGLWEHCQGDDGEIVESCAIITTDVNDMVRSIHVRMPVIVAPRDHERWLAADAKPDELQALLRPYPSAEMMAYLVSTRVNNPRNDDPQCCEAA